MSKIIRVTEEHKEALRAQFEAALAKMKIADGKFSFNRSFSDTGKKAKLYFTETAWLKMQTLIREYQIEIGWYGVASRVEDEENAYIVSDILVYPQSVTGTTVDMDAEKTNEWIFENREDDRFNNIRAQGHSHVNMETGPSGVDLGHQEDILEMLDDGFYIFMIWNKRGEKNIKIYDLDQNILFETADITVSVKNEIGLDDFLADAKKKAVSKSYSAGYNAYGNAYNGYSSYNKESGKTDVHAYTQPTTTSVAPAAKTETKPAASPTAPEPKPVNGKYTKKGKPVSHSGKAYQPRVSDYDAYGSDVY